MAPASARPANLTHPWLNVPAIFGFNGGQAGVEQPKLRHDNDVKARSELVTSENLSNQSFSSVSPDRVAQLARGGDPKAAHGERVGQQEHGRVSAGYPRASLVDLLEFCGAAKPFVARESGHLLAADRQTLAAFRAAAL